MKIIIKKNITWFYAINMKVCWKKKKIYRENEFYNENSYRDIPSTI